MPQVPTLNGSSPYRHSLRDAVLTGVAVLLAFAALDDITTDHDTSFTFERLLLAACALCLAFVASNLIRDDHRVLGGVSIAVLTIAAAAQFRVGQDTTGGRTEYLVVMAGLLWFLVLAVVLAARAVKERPRAT
jgi:peptidoglycan/LPS O-acetylase OafA/YrhL